MYRILKRITPVFIILFLLPNALQAKQKPYDVIIVGAGVTGLTAATQLKSQHYKVLVLEGRDRVGGRIWSIQSKGGVMDLGASWIHGVDNNPVSELMKQVSKIPTTYTSADFKKKLEDMALYDKEGKRVPQAQLDVAIQRTMDFIEWLKQLPKNKGISIATAMDQYARNKAIHGDQRELMQDLVNNNYLSEFGANLDTISTDIEKLYSKSKASGKQVILPQGYSQLINIVSRGIPIKLNEQVLKISYSPKGVITETKNHSYFSKRVIVTVPVGVLKANKIVFNPVLPKEKIRAISHAKMGTLDKVVLHFPKVFWDKDKEWICMPSSNSKRRFELDAMNMYKLIKKPVLIVFPAGIEANELERLSDKQIIKQVMNDLRLIYGENSPYPDDYKITRWHQDPFSYGSFSYLPKDSPLDYFAQIAKPVNDRLFFAGEATSDTDSGTVHGAYLSALRAAKEVSASLG